MDARDSLAHDAVRISAFTTKNSDEFFEYSSIRNSTASKKPVRKTGTGFYRVLFRGSRKGKKPGKRSRKHPAPNPTIVEKRHSGYFFFVLFSTEFPCDPRLRHRKSDASVSDGAGRRRCGGGGGGDGCGISFRSRSDFSLSLSLSLPLSLFYSASAGVDPHFSGRADPLTSAVTRGPDTVPSPVVCLFVVFFGFSGVFLGRFSPNTRSV